MAVSLSYCNFIESGGVTFYVIGYLALSSATLRSQLYGASYNKEKELKLGKSKFLKSSRLCLAHNCRMVAQICVYIWNQYMRKMHVCTCMIAKQSRKQGHNDVNVYLMTHKFKFPCYLQLFKYIHHAFDILV